MTPYRLCQPNTPQELYNKKHSMARSIIERTIGVMKGKFRCILGARELHYSPVKARKIINTVCCLHNICLQYKAGDSLSEADFIAEESTDSNELAPVTEENNAAQLRNEIMTRFLS